MLAATDLTTILKDLDWLRAVLISGITGGGSVAIFKLWKLFSKDFLTPWRDDTAAARKVADDALEEAATARAEAAALRKDLYRCQEREQKMRLVLINAGLPVDPITPEEPT